MVAEEVATHGIECPPKLREGMEAMDKANRYVLYRWESDIMHASTTGLRQLVDPSGPVTLVGTAGSPAQQLARIAVTWEVASDLFELVANALGLELPGWDERRPGIEHELEALFEFYKE